MSLTTRRYLAGLLGIGLLIAAYCGLSQFPTIAERNAAVINSAENALHSYLMDGEVVAEAETTVGDQSTQDQLVSHDHSGSATDITTNSTKVDRTSK